jgi:predicted CopG family antitoxin
MNKLSTTQKGIIITILWFTLLFLFAVRVTAQTVGTTKTESYKASFETKINIDSLMDYDGPQIPIQILTIGISDEVYEQYPELKEKKVGLGVANIVLEYLSELNRFTFTEDKTEIKNRMVKQFQASQAGISQT